MARSGTSQHKHDTKGRVGPDEELSVGPEWVTYRNLWCSCGDIGKRIVVSRRKK